MSRKSADAERRHSILEAARWCFLNFGFSKTSLADIAQRAQLSRPLLYLQFKNKEDIFAAVFEDWLGPRLLQAEAVARSNKKPKAKLLEIFDGVVLQPWIEMQSSPMGAEFYATCERLTPAVEARFRKGMVKCLTPILQRKDVVEVFMLALDGLQGDLPDGGTLRKRVEILIDRFVP